MTDYSNINTGITQANAGESVTMTDGIYDLTSILALTKPLASFQAKNYGKATIIGGAIDLKADGIKFKGFNLQYKNSREQVAYILGKQCEVTDNNCQFANSLGTTVRQDWWNIKNNDNLFQRNDCHGKTGRGNMLLLGTGSLQVQNNKVLNNKFHDFHVTNYGSITNGYEFVRMGSSTAAAKTFNTEFAGNEIYDNNVPETELVTVKSSGNDLHDNYIHNVTNTTTFRHGRFNKFRNNKVFGSGLRIYGKGHEVSGNQFIRNPNNQLRQVVIGNGKYAEEEQNTDALYTQVRDLVFKNNYIIGEDSTSNILLCMGYGNYNLKPVNNQFIDNIITGAKGTLANTHDGASWTGNTLSNNIQWVTGTALYGNMPGPHQDPKLIKNADGTYSIAVVPTPTPTPTPTSNIYDDFKYNYNFTESSKSPNGKWQSIYLGYGTATVDGNGLTIQPKAGGLAAALIRSTWLGQNYLAEWDVTHIQQVATNPQQWMCPWGFIRYLDERRHYYFYTGLTHCEFGKKDAPADATDIEAYQKTIWTGGPATPLGTKRHIGFQAIGDIFTIWVDGQKIMEKTDVSSFKSGAYCIYIEGAKGYYQNIAITSK